MHSNTPLWEEFLGLNDQHLTRIQIPDHYKEFGSDQFVNSKILEDWEIFIKQAREYDEGLSPWPISSFRSFERQLQIWNKKARGESLLRDRNDQVLEYATVKDNEEKLLWTILNWSALPGLSRHHWGTDLDIVNLSALKNYKEEHKNNYQVNLCTDEYSQTGIFHLFNSWMNTYEKTGQALFARPYDQDYGATMPEPWHISHCYYSKVFLSTIEYEGARKLRDLIKSDIYKGMELREVVLKNLNTILEKYTKGISSQFKLHS